MGRLTPQVRSIFAKSSPQGRALEKSALQVVQLHHSNLDPNSSVLETISIALNDRLSSVSRAPSDGETSKDSITSSTPLRTPPSFIPACTKLPCNMYSINAGSRASILDPAILQSSRNNLVGDRGMQ